MRFPVNGISPGTFRRALFRSVFHTVDFTPPAVTAVSVEGQTLYTMTPLIVVNYSDNFSGINESSLVLRLDGQDIRNSAVVYGNQALYTVPASAPLGPGQHVVEAQVSDNAGNVSALKSALFRVDDVPPEVTSLTINGWPLVEGMRIRDLRPVISATYVDPSGINPQGTRLLFGPAGGPLVQVAAPKASWTHTLVNPGAEQGTTGWTNEMGGLVTRNANPAPHGGSWYFGGGPNLQTRAYQEVDLAGRRRTG